MSTKRKYNLIIFGASAITGKFSVEEILKTVKAGQSESFTWAVAGRSETKIRDALNEIGKYNNVDLSSVEILIGNVEDKESLEYVASQCDVLANMVGPYAKYGEQVIQACIKVKTNYVDLSAESHNLTLMQIRYNDQAREAGIYVVGSCGFDSIPNECGINYLKTKFGGDLNSVDSYVYLSNELLRTTASYGSWTSILHFYAQFRKLRPLLNQLYPNELPKPKFKQKSKCLLHKNNTGENGWCLPFPHPDIWAVERSQNYFYEKEKKRPVQFQCFLKLSYIWMSLVVVIGVLCLGPFLLCRCGVYLLDTFPRFFSFGFINKKGPTRRQMERLKFSSTLIGKGWNEALQNNEEEYSYPPDKKVVVKFDGVNPYGAISTFLIQSALTILFDSSNLPSNGGVYTPGVAFEKSSIIDRLNKNGVNVNIINTSKNEV